MHCQSMTKYFVKWRKRNCLKCLHLELHGPKCLNAEALTLFTQELRISRLRVLGYAYLKCASMVTHLRDAWWRHMTSSSQLQFRRCSEAPNRLKIASKSPSFIHHIPATSTTSKDIKTKPRHASPFSPVHLLSFGPAGACMNISEKRIEKRGLIWGFQIRRNKWKSKGTGL